MPRNKQEATDKMRVETDEDIRKLVVARLQVLSPDTIKVIGDEGSFDRDSLIERVKAGDQVGQTVIGIEMEWLRVHVGVAAPTVVIRDIGDVLRSMK